MQFYLFSPRVRTVGSRFIGFGLAAMVAVSLSHWHHSIPYVEHILWLIGWMLVGLGVMGRIWCSIYISGFKNAKLVMLGPYSLCRNPLYLFSFFGGMGIMMLTETFLYPLIFAVIYLAYYRYVIGQEERFLSVKYGEVYQQYFKTVPRFWPNFSNYHEPESYLVSPKHIRLFLGQVVWFIWVAALVQLFEELRMMDMIPTLLHLA